VSNFCLKPIRQFFSHIMARTGYILMRWWWWRRLCTRHAEFNFYSASLLKQQSTGRHIVPLGHYPDSESLLLWLQLPVQSVPIAKAVSSNLFMTRCTQYNIMW